MLLISACLLGAKVKYNGSSNYCTLLAKYKDCGLFIPICPECLGQLTIPRLPAEITGGDGSDVLNGTAKVYDNAGYNVTENFIKGVGCVAGPLLGIPAGFAAAVGLTAVFCGATNCPLASIFLSVELFGDGGLLYFALACGISYMLSGYNGLYSSQTIVYSKLKAQYINVRTNAHHAGEPVDPFHQEGSPEGED